MDRKFNISYVLSGRGRAGGVRVTVDSATEMLKRGHRVRILYYRPRFQLGRWARNVLRRGRHPWRYEWIPRPLVHRGNYDWLDKIAGEVEPFHDLNSCSFERGEVLIGIGIFGCGALDDLSNRDVVPLQYYHGMSFGDEEMRLKACRAKLPKIVVSSSLIDAVRERGGKTPFAVVHNGIHLTDYFPSAPDQRRTGIGTIYSAADAKDPNAAIAVFEKVRRERADLPIRVFGTGRQPKEIVNAEYTRFPSIETVRNIYSRTAVWLLASRSEGFGAPILEAMACGCAVVSTRCGGPEDIIEDGVNGFLVDVGDVASVVERAFTLIDNPDLRRRIVQNGLETAKRFTWERATDQLEAAIAKVLQGEHSDDSRSSVTLGGPPI